jgi:hypothetical protein
MEMRPAVEGLRDAHKGLFYWLSTFALSVSTEVINRYEPQPPSSEQGQKKGKRGNEGRLDHNGDATMIGPLSQCQHLKGKMTQNGDTLSGLQPHDSNFDARMKEVRPAGLPAKWKSGWPDGHAAKKQSVVWARKVYAFCLRIGWTRDARAHDVGQAPGGKLKTLKAGSNAGSKQHKRWPLWPIVTGLALMLVAVWLSSTRTAHDEERSFPPAHPTTPDAHGHVPLQAGEERVGTLHLSICLFVY